jgi:vitamin B12/bleomycin/antimicrobial peptide transport system ATP-binding/permease protein
MEQDERGAARRRYLTRRFWRSALGFWGRHGDRVAWLLTIGLLAVIAVQLVIQYELTVWNRSVFDALEKRDGHGVLIQALIFPPLAVVSVLSWMLVVYARLTMERRWRAWLNDHVVDYWLGHGHYYQLNLIKGEDHKNPEYRIADDLRIATESPVEFASGIVSAVLSAITFVVVLWTIGGALSLPVGGINITIPGFLVVAAVIYAVIASGSMVLIGRRFIEVSERKNQAEAEYRYALTRIRENGESIALLGGEQEERAGLDNSLRAALRRWRQICFQQMRTTIVYQGSGIISPVLPIILCAPKFLDGSMSLGQVMQAASAFVIVQQAFSWLVDHYPKFADWTASARRVASLLLSLDHLRKAEEGEGFGRIHRDTATGTAITLRNLSVTLDDGTAVVNEAEVAIAPGERVLVVGESGTGKSTLVRAIAGLWPWGEGDVLVQSDARLFLLPQRPYVPLGTLRRATTYPASPDEVDEETIIEALKLVGLEHLVDRLDEEIAWEQTLSGGEKQRLAFARLLIHRPDVIVLDEATSALDPPSQEALMRLLMERLNATMVSVGHRPELEAFHERKLVLESRTGGARLVRDEDLPPTPPSRRRFRWRWRGRSRRGEARENPSGQRTTAEHRSDEQRRRSA